MLALLKTQLHDPFGLVLIIMPVFFFIAGMLLKKYPPSYPGPGMMNTKYGYRSFKARQSEQNWIQAQNIFCDFLVRCSPVFLIINLGIYQFTGAMNILPPYDTLMHLAPFMLFSLLSIVSVELSFKSNRH